MLAKAVGILVMVHARTLVQVAGILVITLVRMDAIILIDK